MYNVDETGLFFKFISKRAHALKRKKPFCGIKSGTFQKTHRDSFCVHKCRHKEKTVLTISKSTSPRCYWLGWPAVS